MSNIDYRKLRKAQGEILKKASFPFPSYAQALFSQVLVSRTPIENALGTNPPRKAGTPSIMSRGPEVADNGPQAQIFEAPQEADEKKSLLQSFGRFVSDSADEESKVAFKGGEIRAKTSKSDIIIKEGELVSSVKPRFVEELTAATKVLFLGEVPKDYNQESPEDNLLGKMIAAMKLPKEQYCRAFITKDSEVSYEEWLGLLKDLPQDLSEIIVVTLGALATNTVLQKKERLSRIHGKEFNIGLQKTNGEVVIRVFPVFHPDILQINPNMKRSAWLDLQKVMQALS